VSTQKANPTHPCLCGHQRGEHVPINHGTHTGHGICAHPECICSGYRPSAVTEPSKSHTHSGAHEAPTHQTGRLGGQNATKKGA
jgi:hypothetical protein